MKNYLLLVFIILSFCIEVNAQKSNYRHQIQIGRSAKYFGDHPMKIGESGLNLGLSIEKSFWLDFPYLSYGYQFTPRFAMQLSFEDCSYTYSRKKSIPSGSISWRRFYEVQWSQSCRLLTIGKVELKGEIIGTYRFKAKETFFFSFPMFGEGIGFQNKINGIGVGGGIEVDYNFYKRYSIALSGNYTRFSDKKGEMDYHYRNYGKYPKNQFSLTLTLGCNFGKVR